MGGGDKSTVGIKNFILRKISSYMGKTDMNQSVTYSLSPEFLFAALQLSNQKKKKNTLKSEK